MTENKSENKMITTHGAFSWFELATTDVEGAKKFYSSLLGWEYSAMGPEMGDYEIINVNGIGVGGISPKPEMAPASMWGTVISVNDVDASAAKAEELGGSVIVPLMDIPGIGRFCMVRDPQGATFSIITYS